jgi:hypothetical protein
MCEHTVQRTNKCVCVLCVVICGCEHIEDQFPPKLIWEPINHHLLLLSGLECGVYGVGFSDEHLGHASWEQANTAPLSRFEFRV